MTLIQKQNIAAMRGKGDSYAKIAAALNISENTVKSFCRRNRGGGQVDDLKKQANIGDACRHCGLSLTQTPHKRQKQFCSSSCRAKWWFEHSAQEKRKAVYAFTCPTCKKEFTAYGNAHRQFCSRACYGASRRCGNG